MAEHCLYRSTTSYSHLISLTPNIRYCGDFLFQSLYLKLAIYNNHTSFIRSIDHWNFTERENVLEILQYSQWHIHQKNKCSFWQLKKNWQNLIYLYWAITCYWNTCWISHRYIQIKILLIFYWSIGAIDFIKTLIEILISV